MEFHVDIAGRRADLHAIEQGLRAQDPGAMVDLDPGRPVLRVDTQLGADEVLAVLHDAGCVVAPQAVVLKPSVCCGGCGG